MAKERKKRVVICKTTKPYKIHLKQRPAVDGKGKKVERSPGIFILVAQLRR
jgi:hypothetical protein